jgi:polysaccharide biosynthesis/export protein
LFFRLISPNILKLLKDLREANTLMRTLRDRIILICLFLAALISLSACASSAKAPAELPAGSKPPEDMTVPAPAPSVDNELVENVNQVVEEARRKRHTYKIGADDLLHIQLWQREDFLRDGVVRDDGTFFVPLAGNVPVAGLSLAEAQAAVRERLKTYIRDPQVVLEIKEYRSQVFFANGQFRTPGAYPVKGTTTVLEGIGAAGGITDEGNLSGAYLVRSGQVVPIDFVSLFTRGTMALNLPLADGDLIYVPSINASRVFVLGEVLRPAGVPIRTGKITLSQAVADAGGFNETTANKRGIKIIRGGLGSGNVIDVDYTDVLKGKRLDLMMLQPGDIVYVPASGLAKWDRALGLILPNLSRIVVDAAAVDTLTK